MRTCPPGTSWYSDDNAQLTTSGPKRGTVTAIVPPGRSTRASSAMALGVGRNVLEHLGGDDPVEAAVGERKVQGVALHHPGLFLLAHLAGIDHGADGVAHLRYLVGSGIEGHDPGATAETPRRHGGPRRTRGRAAARLTLNPEACCSRRSARGLGGRLRRRSSSSAR